MSIMEKHQFIERNATLLLVGSLLVVSIGGIVEIAPLFYLQNTIEKVEGMRPYSPLELAGRNIYIREGCYVCHSQMIRPFRDEVSATGTIRWRLKACTTTPSNGVRSEPALIWPAWVTATPMNGTSSTLGRPRDVVPESIMPGYAFLKETPLKVTDVTMDLKANKLVGVPYSDEMMQNAKADLAAQADPNADTAGLLARYPKAKVGDFDGNPAQLTEMDALVAYLQMLGTLVDFTTYDDATGYR